ncbi:MAG: hypothetical protein OXF62_17735 [Caldilineaceae bacterium]|nr:hypothetical protein [Caldilineaceae bacterium]
MPEGRIVQVGDVDPVPLTEVKRLLVWKGLEDADQAPIPVEEQLGALTSEDLVEGVGARISARGPLVASTDIDEAASVAANAAIPGVSWVIQAEYAAPRGPLGHLVEDGTPNPSKLSYPRTIFDRRSIGWICSFKDEDGNEVASAFSGFADQFFTSFWPQFWVSDDQRIALQFNESQADYFLSLAAGTAAAMPAGRLELYLAGIFTAQLAARVISRSRITYAAVTANPEVPTDVLFTQSINEPLPTLTDTDRITLPDFTGNHYVLIARADALGPLEHFSIAGIDQVSQFELVIDGMNINGERYRVYRTRNHWFDVNAGKTWNLAEE